MMTTYNATLLGSQMVDAVHRHAGQSPHTVHLCLAHTSFEHLNLSAKRRKKYRKKYFI